MVEPNVFPKNQLAERSISIPITRRISASCRFNNGSGRRHDNYGFALSAQPGESQRRPATNTSSQLIGCIGLPAPSCSRCFCPGWLHHTPRSTKSQPNISTADLIPVTNVIEALNSKLRRAVRTRGHFPGGDAAMKLLYLVLNNAAQEWKRPPARVSRGQNAIRRRLRRTVLRLMTNRPHAQNSLAVPPFPLHSRR